ncbi:hypothetical protein LAV_00116 [Sphingobium phage Lacusarx]|uniref:Uncharacterized protein n=1 Tax=Sphingobium phage Lacusarx TaxID=1980139 RepID=A0A1W6DX69_9CAUD|nr:hypothetical protein FDH44_gp187 [Sphingobium phage Lacusarx]ARK07491.1 hypothetical protein LAV_00116 [Sphingobium phage Lacusarx]
MALQAMIKGLQHLNTRHFTMRHMKVLMAAQLCIRIMKGGYPRAVDIATFARLEVPDFEAELRELVEKKYLHEIVPSFGPLVMRYKIGSMGGTLLRKMMRAEEPPARPKSNLKVVKDGKP